ncbi:MAG: hypothetical protein ABEI77_07075 [Halorientalis sp.]
MAPLRATLRERLGFRSVATLGIFLVVMMTVFDEPPVQVATSLLMSGITEGAGLVADSYDLGEGVRRLGFGLSMLFWAAVLIVVPGERTIAAGVCIVGVWLVADSIQSLRHGGIAAEANEPADGQVVYRQYLERRVLEALGDQSRSRVELLAAFEADAADVERALADLRDQGLIEQSGGVYHKPTTARNGPIGRAKNGLVAFAVRVAGLVRRVARPITIEFGDEGADVDY